MAIRWFTGNSRHKFQSKVLRDTSRLHKSFLCSRGAEHKSNVTGLFLSSPTIGDTAREQPSEMLRCIKAMSEGVSEPHLDRIDLELTNYCNLSCWMCPRREMVRPIGYISLDLVDTLAPQIAELGVRFMHLHLFGESILHPYLDRVIDSLRRYAPDVWLQLSTNATFLNVERFQKIAGRLNLLTVSLDGAAEGTYSMHRIHGRFGHVMRQLRTVLDYRLRTGQPAPIFEISMINLGQSDDEKDDLGRLFRDLLLPVDRIHFKSLESFGGTVVNLEALREPSCIYLNNAVAIYWNGDVTTCCKDCHGKNVIGNLGSLSLREIFYSKRYAHLRTLYASGELQKETELLCHTCLRADYSRTALGRGCQVVPDSSVGLVTIRADAPHPLIFAPPTRKLTVHVSNNTGVEFRSEGEHPIYLSYHWLEEGTGKHLIFDGLRTPLLPSLPSGSSAIYETLIVAPSTPGRYILRVTFVQEGVRWFDQHTPPVCVDLPTIVDSL